MTSYELQQTRLQTNTGIILRNHEYLELFRVKDINIKRPLHLMIFGLANVYIHSSDKTTPIIKLSGVSKFKDKADLLTKLVHEARYSHGVREID